MGCGSSTTSGTPPSSHEKPKRKPSDNNFTMQAAVPAIRHEEEEQKEANTIPVIGHREPPIPAEDIFMFSAEDVFRCPICRAQFPGMSTREV